MKNIFNTMTSVIQIAHCTNPTLTYKVGANALHKAITLQNNKINIVNNGTVDALVFIVKYLNCYEVDTEVAAPEYPLIEKIKLHDLFELELHIFEDLLNLLDNGKQNIQKSKFISALLSIAEELKMHILITKLSAIIAYNMQLL